MTKITNANGIEIDFDAAVILMDDEIVKELEGQFGTEQEFFAAYCARHTEKYGEEFEANKPNPVW